LNSNLRLMEKHELLGGTQFEAERMAIIQLMRNEGFEYDDIVFKKKISEKPTGEWI